MDKIKTYYGLMCRDLWLEQFSLSSNTLSHIQRNARSVPWASWQQRLKYYLQDHV